MTDPHAERAKLIEKLLAAADSLASWGNRVPMTTAVLREAADALSLLPAPLGVSEGMVEAALAAFDTGVGDPNDYRSRMRIALQAAIAASGGESTG